MDSGLKVAEAFADQSVLVTGASGFLGKVLVEKLLYSVPHINKIYVLIRPLKGRFFAKQLKTRFKNKTQFAKCAFWFFKALI